MAELNTGDGGGGKGGKVRSKKQNSKVDLTAMVDLAFLLITFFMLTTSLSKPQSMDLSLPDKDPDDKTPPVKVDENRTMTVMMGENNKMVYYMGLLATPKVGPKDIAYGKDGIRKELLKQKKEVLAYSAALGKPKNGIIVIIKPTKKATYRNLVDMLDEMAITGVDTYAIVPEFSPEETKLIDKQ
ncbi:MULTISPECIES: biopolymer transporter ExbD [Flavobacterium]|uniref:Biopolymer transporter ExbD n=2 Tax=Flavobacterium TaxID=237 RepID=A0A1S1J8E7_9FLAO|nr:MULTISPECIES: biopolymer transporter ExbD [Flavobacterium]MCC9017305.1 biopolymer transporter ExbD [Flavobacterium sp. F-126]OHT46942.1 biopolymer transporter ExbD [Flavobacterium tructae]OXB21249.1 biopolymer transporter ExbD [Flavobacterium tructae]OXB23662.1 biopolymer transporter ExbD [Flavobacterium tructae]